MSRDMVSHQLRGQFQCGEPSQHIDKMHDQIQVVTKDLINNTKNSQQWADNQQKSEIRTLWYLIFPMMDSQLGEAITCTSLNFSTKAVIVFLWQWSSYPWMIKIQSSFGRSFNCTSKPVQTLLQIVVSTETWWLTNYAWSKDLTWVDTRRGEQITVNSFISLDFFAASYKKGMPKSRFPTRTGSTRIFMPFSVQSQLFPCNETFTN